MRSVQHSLALSSVDNQHPFCLTCLETSVEAQTWSDAIRCNRQGCECILELSDLKGIVDDELLANHALALQKRTKRNVGKCRLTSTLKEVNDRIEEISEKVAESSDCECPNLCVLWPVKSSRFSFSRPFSREYHLHFLCAYDLTPVSSNNSIDVRKPRKWVANVLTVLSFSLWTLSVLCKVMNLPIPIPIPGIDGNEKLENLANSLSLSDLQLEYLEEMIDSLDHLKNTSGGVEELQKMIADRANGLDPNAQAELARLAKKHGNLGWKTSEELIGHG